jgi:hypothetical protein
MQLVAMHIAMVIMQVDEELKNGTRSPDVTQTEPRIRAPYFTAPVVSLERAQELYAACFIKSNYMLSEVYKVSNNCLEALTSEARCQDIIPKQETPRTVTPNTTFAPFAGAYAEQEPPM